MTPTVDHLAYTALIKTTTAQFSRDDTQFLTYCGYCWTSYFGIFFAAGSLCSDLTEMSKHIRVHTLEEKVVDTYRQSVSQSTLDEFRHFFFFFLTPSANF